MPGGFADTLQGGVGGAMAGGSIGGPWGAAIGGGLGLLGGYFGGGGADQYNQQLQDWYGQGAPQAGPAAQGQNSGFRHNQAGLISRLEALSQGQGPSLAMAQMQAATDRNQKGQQSLAAGARGPNAAMAQFQAANNAAGLGAQAAQDSVAARIAEQQMALQQLGLTIHGARGADEDMSRFNAGAKNDRSLANMQSQGMNRQGQLQALQMMMGGAGPSMGERLLSGGAGVFGMMSTQNAQNRAAQQA